MSPSFFESVIGAGAILTGFCGTFLAFRIQREASYYRQPALDFQERAAVDVAIKLTHFTPALFLLCIATLLSVVSGFVLPLLAIAGVKSITARPGLVVAGMLSAVVCLGGYFISELVHYEVLSNHLVNDVREWRRGRVIVIGTLLLAALAAIASWWIVAHLPPN